jgi:DNA-binding NarL/FixJ family response regulator
MLMIRVLIVDNLQRGSDLLSTILNEQPDMKLIAHFTTASQALPALGTADVILLGTGLANDDAYRLTRTMKEGNFLARILILGQSDTNKTIIRYLEAGAHGFIRTKDPIKELPEKIRCAAKGEVIISSDLAPDLVDRLAELASYFEAIAPTTEQLASLTPREQEILHLISQNYSNRDIADLLIIEVGTVKNHVHNILSKLNVSSRREATRYLLSAYGPIRANQHLSTYPSMPAQNWITSTG